MREDCFACESKTVNVMGCTEHRMVCSALNEALCEKKRSKGMCPFYKQRDEYLKDLYRRHGTTDMNAIVGAYKQTYGG